MKAAETILVVDGDSGALAAVNALLARQGYKTFASVTYAEALQVLHTQSLVALVVVGASSTSAPVASFIEQVFASRPEIDVLSLGVDVFGDAGQQDPRVSFLAKPYQEDDLIRCIRHLLDNREQRRLLREATALAPVAKAHDQPAPASVADAPAGFNILLVEDNPETLWATGELLTALGHRVTSAGSAEEALQKLPLDNFDILCSDISLPGMSGAELAGAVRDAHPGIGIIFASGYGTVAGVDKDALKAVMLPKPYTMAALEAALTAARQAL